MEPGRTRAALGRIPAIVTIALLATTLGASPGNASSFAAQTNRLFCYTAEPAQALTGLSYSKTRLPDIG